MAKIMLVEDDNNLREIYGARLLAEGHDIVAAQDGEEALALAVKEKPDLIISDVMMPRISGFDMLDILRNAPETKDTKVIMMTALSQAEDKARADKLGANRYLVKSQVTLEDVANVVREVLDEGNTAEAPPAEEESAAVATMIDSSAPATEPVQPAPQSAAEPALVAEPAPVITEAPTPQPVAAEQPVDPVPAPTMPEITSIPDEPTLTPPAPATVEQIANPVVEMPDDTETPTMQAPPTLANPAEEESAALDALIHQDGSSIPQPQSVAVAPTPEPAPAAVQAPAPVPAPSATDLPPVVEPAPAINVVMPTPLDGTKEQSAPAAPVPAPAQPVAPAPVTTDDQPVQQPVVEPSLLEALKAEENDDPQSHSQPAPEPVTKTELPPASDANMPEPIIANGVAVPPVVTPTEPQPEPQPEATPDAAAEPTEAFQSAIPDGGGVKRVIQPLNDTSGPDINELLAKEEQKAAVANPVASTVITPAPAQSQQPVVKQQPQNDDVNSIAL